MTKVPGKSGGSSGKRAKSDAGDGGLLGGGGAGGLPSAEPAAAAVRLDQIIGQRHPVNVLRAAIASGRVHHAWIFAGPAGVGKFTTAVALAAELLTATPSGSAEKTPPSAVEEIRRLIAAGAHPDVHVVRKELASVSSDAAIRKLKQTNIAKKVVEEFLLLPASRSRVRGDLPMGLMGKVFIIDEAELMDTATQNQVLKTLEEPPAGTMLVLITSDESGLLPTVRSRCQRVSFSTLNDRDMQAWMEHAGVKIDPDISPWLLRFAAGSPGTATVALRNDLHQWHATLEPLLTSIDKGAPSPQAVGLGSLLAKLVDERAAKSVEGRAEASKEAANREWCRRMLSFLAERWRGQLRRATTNDDASRCVRGIRLCDEAERLMDSNVQIGALMDNLAAQLMSPGAVVEVA